MFKFNNSLLSQVYYWFGLVMAVFGFFTEVSGQQLYLSSSFYLEMSIVSFLAAIALSSVSRK